MQELQVAPKGPVQYLGLHHLAMVTTDMDRTVRFYRDLLGMPLAVTLSEGVEGEPDFMRLYMFNLGKGSTLAFFEWPSKVAELLSTQSYDMPIRQQRFDHVAIQVENLEALQNLRTYLLEHQVAVSEVIDHQQIRSIYFNDPDGIALEASCNMVNQEDLTLRMDRYPVKAVVEN
jgi:catechol 2,3-dioxygenase-like lactoylglutathione lyase family enzyme